MGSFTHAACVSDYLLTHGRMIPLNQGILDLGSIGEASNLSVINLAFNKLESLRGLSSLSNLATLNISHNQIT